MVNSISKAVAFVRTGLAVPALKRLAGVRPRFPSRPELGEPVPLPFGAFEEHRCFACSARAASGLRLSFYRAPGWSLACTWRAEPPYENYPGMLHGGIIVTILDELLGQAVFHEIGYLPVSVSAKVAWHKPVKMGEEVVAAARITSRYERFCTADAWLFRSDGKVAAEMHGTYFTPSLEHFRKLAELDFIAPAAHGWFAPRERANGQGPADSEPARDT